VYAWQKLSETTPVHYGRPGDEISPGALIVQNDGCTMAKMGEAVLIGSATSQWLPILVVSVTIIFRHCCGNFAESGET
jgi:hypothetical protein